MRRSANANALNCKEEGSHILKLVTDTSKDAFGLEASRLHINSDEIIPHHRVDDNESTRYTTQLINKRQRHSNLIRHIYERKNRFERLAYLEGLISKQGQILKGKNDNTEQKLNESAKHGKLGLTSDEKMLETMKNADIILGMSPGVNQRYNSRKVNRLKKQAQNQASGRVTKTFGGLVGSFAKFMMIGNEQKERQFSSAQKFSDDEEDSESSNHSDTNPGG